MLVYQRVNFRAPQKLRFNRFSPPIATPSSVRCRMGGKTPGTCPATLSSGSTRCQPVLNHPLWSMKSSEILDVGKKFCQPLIFLSINDHLMIQQRSLLQSNSRQVHVGLYHLFTKESRSKFSKKHCEHQINFGESKRCLPVFQPPPRFVSTSNPPFSHPLWHTWNKALTQGDGAISSTSSRKVFKRKRALLRALLPNSQKKHRQHWHDTSWLTLGILQMCGTFPSCLPKYPHYCPPNLLPGTIITLRDHAH